MKKLIIFFLILLIGFPAFAQEKPLIKVYVGISGNPRVLAESYIKRELRSLGDVTIVDILDENADYAIYILVDETKLKNGHKIGFHCAWAVVEPIPGCAHFRNVLLFYDQDLKKICQRIVADFDINYLEEIRKQK